MRVDVKRKTLSCSPVRGHCLSCIQPAVHHSGAADLPGTETSRPIAGLVPRFHSSSAPTRNAGDTCPAPPPTNHDAHRRPVVPGRSAQTSTQADSPQHVSGRDALLPHLVGSCNQFITAQTSSTSAFALTHAVPPQLHLIDARSSGKLLSHRY
jgi:hypothetical protein